MSVYVSFALLRLKLFTFSLWYDLACKQLDLPPSKNSKEKMEVLKRLIVVLLKGNIHITVSLTILGQFFYTADSKI